MLENIGKLNKLSKKDYKALLPALRQQLLEVQRELGDAKFPVIVVFSGVDGAGKGETVNALNAWMDPRWIYSHAYSEPSDEEAERPKYWRFWRDLPPRGQIGLFLSAWYSEPLLEFVKDRSDGAAFDRRLERIAEFEQNLIADGALILKFWMHLGRKDQKKRLRRLEEDPLTAWRVNTHDWEHWHLYDRFTEAAERQMAATGTEQSPWHVVDGACIRRASVTVAETLRDAIRERLKGPPALAAHGAAKYQPSKRPVLGALDPDMCLERSSYTKQLAEYQAQLNLLQRRAHDANISTILMFEGWDAAGKGGAIRRIIHALDAKHYRVIPIAAPTQEELAQHYLWRFWRHIPRAGRVTIFDRSWYGRVLVERIEGFAQPQEWQRAYQEIRQFEQALTSDRVVLCKFWVHITKDEQLRRFKDREQTPHKAWKLTEEDWRNREQWDAYEAAVDDMVALTHTERAPWTLVEGNQKEYARVKILRTVCERMTAALNQQG